VHHVHTRAATERPIVQKTPWARVRDVGDCARADDQLAPATATATRTRFMARALHGWVDPSVPPDHRRLRRREQQEHGPAAGPWRSPPRCSSAALRSSSSAAATSRTGGRARAATGRDLVVKFEGGYHGHADHLLASAGSGVATQGEAPPALERLTAREVEIARLLTYGLTDGALASHLGISVRTASKHVENLRMKLEMRSRWQVAEWAVEQGLRDI